MDEELKKQLDKMFSEANRILAEYVQEITVMTAELTDKLKLPDLSGNVVKREYELKKKRIHDAEVPWDEVLYGKDDNKY